MDNPVLKWIEEHKVDGFLDEDTQFDFVKEFGKNCKVLNNGFTMAPGLVEHMTWYMGDEDNKNIKLAAQILDKAVVAFMKDDTKEELKIIFELFDFLLENSTSSLSTNFIELVTPKYKENDDKYYAFLMVLKHIVEVGMNKIVNDLEPIKFAIYITGYFNDNMDKKAELLEFGLSDELARYVAEALYMQDDNESIFALAQKTHGYGRISYIMGLEPSSKEIKDWLIFEGYKNYIDYKESALLCAQKGNLLGHLSPYYIIEGETRACKDLLLGICEKNDMRDYEDGKKVIFILLDRFKEQNEIDLDDFYTLCVLWHHLKDIYLECGWQQSEFERFEEDVRLFAFNKGINWQQIIKENFKDYRTKIIAKTLSIETWDLFYQDAQNANSQDINWYELASTNDKIQFQKVCELARQKIPLEKIAVGVGDELGIEKIYKDDDDLSFIIQELRKFDEIIAPDLVAISLQSKVVRVRNMALNVLEHWLKISNLPADIISILKRNIQFEKEDNQTRYQKILNKI